LSIRIVIADDHRIFRQGLKVLLEKEPDMEVVGEAEDGCRAATLIRELVPDVVVMDVKMPDMDGIEASRQILSELPDVKIIALSIYSDSHFVTDMLKAGAHGYLLKDSAFEELVQAIRLAISNKTYLSPRLAEIVVKDDTTIYPSPRPSVYSVLTSRERDVLKLIAKGKRNSQIAKLLNVSVKTVEAHRQHIMQKLGTRSIAQLTKYAIREGLNSLEN
jgi:DNA-binding NarL/FixJ family response regulator